MSAPITAGYRDVPPRGNNCPIGPKAMRPPAEPDGMSTSPTEASGGLSGTAEPTDYELLLARCETALEEAMYQVEKGRVRQPSHDKTRQGWHRSAKDWIQEMRLLLNAKREAEQVEQRLAELEAVAGIDSEP